ncbi:response regulator transcription factor [Ketobacter sp. MCCC 1A13808]|uniref:response regulator transcription factor n=1 Tax=Ketobacter sp. MCCC 1A13808 TaxID=2602738 RepID=UPI0012EB973E|nr:response regulator transcription factor [Ketobacter sp. MCCC 1A13808]MVF12053.1 response regulator transcription factor [Ketobacter sp. MCCC 1A13808]
MKMLIADDHALMREAVILKLQAEFPDARFYESACFEDTLEQLQSNPLIDVAIIDLHMPGMQGITSIQCFLLVKPETPIAIFSNEQNTDLMLEILNSGVQGFIPKTEATAVIVKAIELILEGSRYIPGAVLAPLTVPATPLEDIEFPLSGRQRELIRYICAGYPNKRIANEMNLSLGTVKQYIHRLYQQLSVSSRVELQNRVRQHAYLEVG